MAAAKWTDTLPAMVGLMGTAVELMDILSAALDPLRVAAGRSTGTLRLGPQLTAAKAADILPLAPDSLVEREPVAAVVRSHASTSDPQPAAGRMLSILPVALEPSKGAVEKVAAQRLVTLVVTRTWHRIFAVELSLYHIVDSAVVKPVP